MTTKEQNNINHEVRNATASISGILRPYWKQGKIPDQHWALVLAKLRKIEKACDECTRMP